MLNSCFSCENPAWSMIPLDPTCKVITRPLYPADLALSITPSYFYSFRSAACWNDVSNQMVSSMSRIFRSESSHQTMSGRRSDGTIWWGKVYEPRSADRVADGEMIVDKRETISLRMMLCRALNLLPSRAALHVFRM